MIKVEPMLPRPAGSAVLAPTVAVAPLPVGSIFPVEAMRDAGSQQLLLLFAGRKWLLKPGGAAGEIEPGTRVQVRVVRNEPELELELVQRTQEISAAMRRELPQQANPLRLLANLDWIARQPAAATRLPETARAAIETAWRGVPTREQLMTAAGLERACRDSGLRLESQLAAATPGELDAALATDWKAVLYKLHDVLTRAGGSKSGVSTDRSDAQVPTRHGPLQSIPAAVASVAQMDDSQAMLSELAQQARESIARVACTQLVSLGANEQAALPLLLEIPYREPAGTGLLRLRIEREEQAARASIAPVWTIEFALDLGQQGPLRGRVTLAEGRVSVTLKPEFAQLAQAIDAHVDELRATLQDAGVPVGKLTCVRSDPLGNASTGAWLVNLRA